MPDDNLADARDLLVSAFLGTALFAKGAKRAINAEAGALQVQPVKPCAKIAEFLFGERALHIHLRPHA